MRVAVFTSFTASYLPNARIVAKSLKQQHPDWDFFALFNDRSGSSIRWEDEPFDEVIFAEWLPIGRPWKHWSASYSVIEFCTATKGIATEWLFDQFGYDFVIYLDPDILVTAPLQKAIDLLTLETADSLLTPHLTDPEEDHIAIWSHEMAAMKHGTFNLGFFAFANRENGRKFLNWWSQRLLSYSDIDFEAGLFTDQKWCNLAPYMFDGIHVITDKTYNTATWNVKNRAIEKSTSGQWTVNGAPLVFYHFSGFGHDFNWADQELARFAPHDKFLRELWGQYKSLYIENSRDRKTPGWHWNHQNDRGALRQQRQTGKYSPSIFPLDSNAKVAS